MTRIIKERPKNGCARCIWWQQNRKDNWGQCKILKDETWWQHAPCVEYERDGSITDDISLIPE